MIGMISFLALAALIGLGLAAVVTIMVVGKMERVRDLVEKEIG